LGGGGRRKGERATVRNINVVIVAFFRLSPWKDHDFRVLHLPRVPVTHSHHWIYCHGIHHSLNHALSSQCTTSACTFCKPTTSAWEAFSLIFPSDPLIITRYSIEERWIILSLNLDFLTSYSPELQGAAA
jgi:hypothetical protein